MKQELKKHLNNIERLVQKNYITLEVVGCVQHFSLNTTQTYNYNVYIYAKISYRGKNV